MPEPSPAPPKDARHDDQRQVTPATSGVRSLQLWVSLLPALAVTLIAVVTVSYLMAFDPTPGVAVLVVALAGIGCVAALIGAIVGARAATRRVDRSLVALRTASTRGRDNLQRLVEQVNKGDRPALRGPGRPPIDGSDEFALLAYDLSYARHAAEDAVLKASSITPTNGSDQRVEVFVNLARRLQSLVHREIQLLDELENQVEDPDLLKGLFQVDHLATRIRRHAENLAVLGGAVSRRQWSRPVTLTEVLRSAIAEVEQYSRVKLVPPIEGHMQGHAVADVIHLVAELVENATMFSAPNSQVLLRAQKVTAGLAIEVDDRGLGMAAEDQQRLNSVLADPSQIDIGDLLRDGRIGLYVVATLARRHHAVARLQTNIYGGVQAVVVLPQALLGGGPEDRDANEPQERQRSAQPAPQQHSQQQSAQVTQQQPAQRPHSPAPVNGHAELPHRQPTHGPQHGQPQHAQPQHHEQLPGQPSPHGQPQHGQPQHGQPQHAQPLHHEQPPGQPQHHGQPGHHAVPSQPTHAHAPAPHAQAQHGRLPQPYEREPEVTPDPMADAETQVGQAVSDHQADPRADYGLPFELPPAANTGQFTWLDDRRQREEPEAEHHGSSGERAGHTATGVARAAVSPVREPEHPPADHFPPSALDGPSPLEAPASLAEDMTPGHAPGEHYAPGQFSTSHVSFDLPPSAPPVGDPQGHGHHPPPTEGRPKLPQRRRQAHLAPELRDMPPPRADEQPSHDPGLMAAFQRGFGRSDPGHEDHGPISYPDRNS